MTNWHKNLVLIAKNTPVWLYQLSKKYQKKIRRLDEIPDEELDHIKSCGINGLWLIGIWERSPASKKIKDLYGKNHLIASAYSIYQYEIAENLGGQKALDVLKKNAEEKNIYLACDLVPNHTGLDSPWIIQHPEWYISSPHKPVDHWVFSSPDLLNTSEIEIHLEDGYYNETGAAEVFLYRNKKSNETRYIYHGNDGTSMPWNDTAQLDYLKVEVRNAVKEQILRIARQFNIIRLDAAMTLVKKHFHRLWFPQNDGLQCIPTREQFGITRREFDKLMPTEFWADVMQEISRSAPGTMLLAEAFWLMEKFFIHDLGIHRVYNSAFMQYLSDENNRAFRKYLMDIIKQDPRLLERFVNYLTTPDEKTAIEQFGKSQKYFGACGLISVLPGLPLFGHGQIEGLSEKYGMDIEQPFVNESPDEDMIAKHKALISPLLTRRSRFSSAEHFVMHDFHKDEGTLDNNVIVFSNISDNYFSLVVFNNQNKNTQGIISDLFEQNDRKRLTINSNRYEMRLKNLQTKEIHFYSIDHLINPCLHLILNPYEFAVFDVQIG